jgi:hypothetical protein
MNAFNFEPHKMKRRHHFLKKGGGGSGGDGGGWASIYALLSIVIFEFTLAHA